MKREYIVQIDFVGDPPGNKELVRCKDCKHRGDKHKCVVAFVADKQEFPIFFYDNRGEWFCADGERKSTDEILMEEMDADPLG